MSNPIYGNPNYFPTGTPLNNQWTPQLKTNKIYVTSLDEALSRTAERYSEMYYWDQSKPVIYVVRTDANMMKSWAEITYNVPNQDNTTPVTKADLVELENRIAALESKTTKKKKIESESEVTTNVESVG
jgi:hypothetical protein